MVRVGDELSQTIDDIFSLYILYAVPPVHELLAGPFSIAVTRAH